MSSHRVANSLLIHCCERTAEMLWWPGPTAKNSTHPQPNLQNQSTSY